MKLTERDEMLRRIQTELKNIRLDIRKVSKKMEKERTPYLKKVENTYKTYCDEKRDIGSEKKAMVELLNYLDNSLHSTTDKDTKTRINMVKDRINILINK